MAERGQRSAGRRGRKYRGRAPWAEEVELERLFWPLRIERYEDLIGAEAVERIMLKAKRLTDLRVINIVAQAFVDPGGSAPRRASAYGSVS